MLDVLYVAWNRQHFTETSFRLMLANTDWSLVRRLEVYDDGSTDGTAEMLEALCEQCPAETVMNFTDRVGPVGVMNSYVEKTDSELFAKIDNDIIVPPGWLNRLTGVMAASIPRLDALGMEAGRMGSEPSEKGWEPARWIGGVGLIRTSALGRRPMMKPNGEGLRFGWTEFQQEYRLACGWVKPDLMCASLDQVPMEPFISLNREYAERGWAREREWPKYHERWMRQYWEWAGFE